MIGFNGQYLSAAAIGDMRITAMSQGDKWLFGSPDWLMSATRAAILSAFGAEGAGVIRATNAYLNGLATTDREKAQALAGFINEDPMLVCSIVETSKTRWLVGDGKAKIVTNIVPTSTTGVKVLVKKLASEYNSFVFSAGSLEDRYGVYEQNNKLLFWYVPNSYTNTNQSYAEPLLIEYNIEGYMRIKNENGEQLYSKELAQNNCSGPIQTGSSLTYPNGIDSYPFFIIETDGEEVWHGIPHLHGGEAGMLDLVSLDFYPNANTEGAFTIQLTDKQ